MADGRRGSGLSGTGLVVVVIVLLGLGAALLLAPPGPTSGVQLLPSFAVGNVPSVFLVYAGAGFLVLAALIAVGGLSNRGATRSFGVLLPLGILLVVAAVVAEILRALGGGVTAGTPAPGRNNTTAPPPTNLSCVGSCLKLPGTPTAPVPWWEGGLVYGLIVAAAILVVALYPRLRARAFDAPRSPPAAAPGPAPALTDALDRLLASGVQDDARIRIMRAYGQLLREVASGLEGLDRRTPREISAAMVAELRISPATAATITGLFEEARYSTSVPLGPGAVERAERALRSAIAESSGPGGPRP